MLKATNHKRVSTGLGFCVPVRFLAESYTRRVTQGETSSLALSKGY